MEKEPNDAAERAGVVNGAFVTSGDLAGSEDWFAWTLSDQQVAQRWTLVLHGPVGAPIELTIVNPEGETIFSGTGAARGRLGLYDLGLAPGTYRIRLGPAATTSSPYRLRAKSEGPRSPTREAEPNDGSALANPLTVARQVGGRLARGNDVDFYSFVIDKALAAVRLEAGLTSTGKFACRLCLLDGKGVELQCREAVAPKLVDLVLAEGSYSLAVSGTADPDASYNVALRRRGLLVPEAEQEPNGTQKTATALEAVINFC